MSDIFSEVEQDLRRERFKKLWDRFGIVVVVAAVIVVAVTAGWRGWVAWSEHRANSTGDQMLAALKLAGDGSHKEAADAFAKVAEGGGTGYRALARLRAAAEIAQAGDSAAAVQAFDALAADGSVPLVYRNLAHIRAGYLVVDGDDRKEVESRVSSLAETANAWRQPARELMGIAAYRAGDLDAAQKWFRAIADDPDGPTDAVDRADVMLSLIAGARPVTPAKPDSAS